MAFFREMDCRLAILRALNEAWEGVVGRNLSWFNQLVSNCRSSWLLGEQNRGNSPHPNPLPVGEGACLRLDGGCGLARFCSPSEAPSRALWVRSAVWDDGAAAVGTGAKSVMDEQGSTRFGARTRMFEAGFGRSHGRRRPKAHRRVPLDKRGRRRYPTSVGRISGERRPLVLFAKESGSFQSHSPLPEGRAKPCRGQSPRVPCGAAASRG